jgi:hypothetical protein
MEQARRERSAAEDKAVEIQHAMSRQSDQLIQPESKIDRLQGTLSNMTRARATQADQLRGAENKIDGLQGTISKMTRARGNAKR